MQEKELSILQTVILLLDDIPEYEIMFQHGLGNNIKKAREIIKIIKDK